MFSEWHDYNSDSGMPCDPKTMVQVQYTSNLLSHDFARFITWDKKILRWRTTDVQTLQHVILRQPDNYRNMIDIYFIREPGTHQFWTCEVVGMNLETGWSAGGFGSADYGAMVAVSKPVRDQNIQRMVERFLWGAYGVPEQLVHFRQAESEKDRRIRRDKINRTGE